MYSTKRETGEDLPPLGIDMLVTHGVGIELFGNLGPWGKSVTSRLATRYQLLHVVCNGALCFVFCILCPLSIVFNSVQSLIGIVLLVVVSLCFGVSVPAPVSDISISVFGFIPSVPYHKPQANHDPIYARQNIVTNNWLTIVILLDYYYLRTQDKLFCETEILWIMHCALCSIESRLHTGIEFFDMICQTLNVDR